MWHQIESMVGKAHHQMLHLDREHWIVVFLLALIVGAICLKGFGSRTGY